LVNIFFYLIFGLMEALVLKKGIDLGFKDVDIKQGIVKGQFCAHNIKDLGGDISIYGSLKKTIEERGPNGKRLIKFCLNHKTENLPGVLKELWEDPIGGFYAAKTGTHNAGIDFLKMVESDIINQHSYAYKTINEDYDPKSKSNFLKELKLFEVSAIEFLGMNPETTYIEVKSMQDALVYVERLEKFIRTTDCTDETIITLEKKLISLQGLLKPSKDTSKGLEADTINEILKTFNI
jgi:uncharacterized protein